MIGLTFGRLKVVYQQGRDKKRNALWFCQCECGNTKVIRGYDLKNGKTTSCGCYNKEQTSKGRRSNNLLGKKFGHLLVIERTNQNGTGKTLWTCACSCGGITKTQGWFLKTGHTKSCGCRSRGNQTHGTIYGIYEKETNNLVYIGQTIKHNLEDRLKSHHRLCKNNKLKLFLFENEVEIKPLIQNVKIDNLDMMEKQLIKIVSSEYHTLLNIHYNG